MELLDRVFATLATPSYFDGLWALLNSIYAYHGDEYRIFVFSHELDESQSRRLTEHPLVIDIVKTTDLPFPQEGAWEAKQQILSHLVKKARIVYLLDCDLVLTSKIDDIFELAETGKIVSSSDGEGLDFGRDYIRFQPRLVGSSHPNLNSGALCIDVQRHWDVAGLWAFASQFGRYSPSGGWPLHLPGHGDQGHLNALLALFAKAKDLEILPETEWCDCTKGSKLAITNAKGQFRLTVENSGTKKQQRLVHSSGPKWWTPEGKVHLSQFGDKLSIFEHFFNALPVSLPNVRFRSSGSRILIGVCSHKRNRIARDAIRSSWASSVPENISVRFFVGDSEIDEPDTISLHCSDDYKELPSKVHAFFKHSVENEDFDFLFKCDDDTYVATERLHLLASNSGGIIGDSHINSHGWFSGGAGYLLPRAIVRAFAAAAIPPEGAEDVIFSKIAQCLRCSIEADTRLRSDKRVRPLGNNELITAHHLKPDEMISSHRLFLSSFPRKCVTT